MLIGVYLFLSIIFSLDATRTAKNACRNCRGKIHPRKQLELTKQPLILDKNQTCLNEQYQFIIIVKSGNYQRRNFTRRTWAKEIIEHFNIPVLYAVGYPANASLEQEILREDELHHDLLQFPILENYYNLTLKTISVLNWYTRHCANNSRYLLYVDDDVLIHVDKLIMYMNEKNDTKSIEGWFETLGKIQRTGLGGISKEDFPIDIVPDYLWGAAVLYPSNILVNVLMKAIFNTKLPIFFRDDVFINGFVADEAGIVRQQMKGVVTYDPTENDLQRNLIVIDFRTEEHRSRAWNCYRYSIQCNRSPPGIILLKILAVMGVILMIGNGCWKCFRSTTFYHQLKYNAMYQYYAMNRERRATVGMKLPIRKLLNRRQIVYIVLLILISMILLIL